MATGAEGPVASQVFVVLASLPMSEEPPDFFGISQLCPPHSA